MSNHIEIMPQVTDSSPQPVYSDNEMSTSETEQIVSPETRRMIELILTAALCSVVALFGMIANIINAIIFLKHGLTNTVNISFLSLAISDFLALAFQEWTNICNIPFFDYFEIPWKPREISYLSGAVPSALFGHVTCWITTYMALERCLCIAMPLKVKQIVTPGRTATFIILAFIINIISVSSEYVFTYIGWKFSPEKNMTLIGLAYRENKASFQGVAYIFCASLGAITFPSVIIFTAILIISLWRQAKWRQSSTTDTQQGNSTTKRDIKTMKMVVLIASILIICYTPGVLTSITTFIIPGMSLTGQQSNLYITLWSFGMLSEAINSSINIFMYYMMSTHYRNTFQEMFSLRSSSPKKC